MELGSRAFGQSGRPRQRQADQTKSVCYQWLSPRKGQPDSSSCFSVTSYPNLGSAFLSSSPFHSIANGGDPGRTPGSPSGTARSNILLIDVEQSHHGYIVELVAALEEGDLDNEQVANQRAAELLDQVACCGGGTACGFNVSLSCTSST